MPCSIRRRPRATRIYPRQVGFQRNRCRRWLADFDAPEADLGVHPTGGDPVSGTADVSFYCDDIEATMRELQTRASSSQRPKTTASAW